MGRHWLRVGLRLEPKNLPCDVSAGPVNAPFADSSAPQPSQPSTVNPRHVQQISAFLAAWIPFLSPCTVVAPIPLCVFLYIFICSRPRRPAAPQLARLARCCPPFVSAASVWRRVICWLSARQLSNCDHQAPPPQRLLGAPALVPAPLRLPNRSTLPPEGSRIPAPLQRGTTLELSAASSRRRVFSLSLVPTSFSSTITSYSNLSFFDTVSDTVVLFLDTTLSPYQFFPFFLSSRFYFTHLGHPHTHMLDSAQ